MKRVMTKCGTAVMAVTLALLASAGHAQEAVPPTPPPSADTPPAQPADVRAENDRRDRFPDFNLYLPEGELDIRVRKLIKNVLFEGQVDYEFVDGDISTFLRYKYYAKNFTYKVGVFDTVRFDSIDDDKGDFERTRGGLLLFEYPTNYNTRYFLLTQYDALTFGDVDDPNNRKANLYTKVAYQFGSPFDERLNAIVGETRGRIPPVLTAYREIGPQKLGLAVALTQSFSSLGGDYGYTKLEGEGLKRLDLGKRTFLISRLHFGTMLQKTRRDELLEGTPDELQYNIPEYELFRLGGRGAMKGVDDHLRGTDEIHLSNEYFAPIFRDKDYSMGVLHWQNLYGILYAGMGTLGYSSSTISDFDNYAIDAGIGFESELSVRGYDVYLTAIYAKTIDAPASLENDEIRFSVRTAR